MLSWNRVFWLPLLALCLSGCDASRENPAVRGIAASVVAAGAFNRAQTAIRRDNIPQLERAGHEMSRAASAGSNPQLVGALVTALAGQAGSLADQSLQRRGEDKIRLEERSNARYRTALAFAPQESPEKTLSAQSLNALGYFLADKGSTREDFERAALLTRAAYQKWDISGQTPIANEVDRATGPQDSYAWALFKLGKYEAARVQQEKAWDLARAMGAQNLTAELPFHLGEIYRALNQDKKARQAYQDALALAPPKALRVLLQSRLQTLDLARV